MGYGGTLACARGDDPLTSTTRDAHDLERRRAGARARRRGRRALPPRRRHRRGALVGVAGGAHRRRRREAPATVEAFLEIVHPDDRAGLNAAVAATAPDGAASQRDLRVVWPDGTAHWYDARWRLVVAGKGGPTIVGIARLIDAERAALARMRFLADVSAALDVSLDMERTLAAVADLCVRDLADWCSIDMAGDDHGLRNVAVAHVDPAKVELAHRMRERYPPDPRAVDRGGPGGPQRRAAALRPRQRRAAGRGRARRRAPRARALARPHVGADRAAARPRARPGRHHAGSHRRARGLHRGRRRLRGGGRRARRAGGRQRAAVRRGARPGARLGRGAGAARRARHRGAHRPGLPRHRLPLRARQRRAGRDQRRAGDRSHRPHRARGAARDGAPRSRPRSRRCWPPARRSSTCRSSARRRASPAAPATTSPATTRSRSRAASAWASASPSPT